MDVTEVKPARVVEEEPNAILVVPIVTELLVNDEFAILVIVLEEPLIVLFVNV